VADAGVEDVAHELHSFGLQLGARGGDVVDVDRGMRILLGLKLHPELARLPDGEAGVADPELVIGLRVGVQPQGVDVKSAGAVAVGRRNADEVELVHGVGHASSSVDRMERGTRVQWTMAIARRALIGVMVSRPVGALLRVCTTQLSQGSRVGRRAAQEFTHAGLDRSQPSGQHRFRRNRRKENDATSLRVRPHPRK
jgi:hypothetical protein